jgi:hypothetical protein
MHQIVNSRASLAVHPPVMRIPLDITEEAGVRLNHLGVLRSEEVTG